MSARPAPNIAVVCGRNACLRRRLTSAVGARATVLGWQDDIVALMRWSDIVITKAGPTTLAEALSQARPLLIHRTLPGQEGGNVALVERLGRGRFMSDVDELVRSATAGAGGQPLNDVAQAAWWASAAQRVAALLLAACGQSAGTEGDAREAAGVATWRSPSAAQVI